MATKEKKSDESIGLPSAAMVVIAVIGAIVTGASFEIIKYWPLPVSVVPYFGWQGGVLWGLVAGAVSGLVLGFCTDDSHFADS